VLFDACNGALVRLIRSNPATAPMARGPPAGDLLRLPLAAPLVSASGVGDSTHRIDQLHAVRCHGCVLGCEKVGFDHCFQVLEGTKQHLLVGCHKVKA
jgi:hypothetical protein